MAKRKNPSGLAIARDGNKFAFSWTKGKNISDVLYQYGTSQSLLLPHVISKDTTKKAITLTWSNYYPTTNVKLSEVMFRLAGRYRLGSDVFVLDWKSKSFAIKKPPAPTVSKTPSGDTWGTCTFSWSMPTLTTHQVLTDIQWQSILVNGSNSKDGSIYSWTSSAQGWQAGTSSTSSSSKSITETASLATGSKTRWFRCRARGPAGASDWRYTKMVYSAPNVAKVTTATYTSKPSGGVQVVAKFAAQYNEAYPIDYAIAQYTIDEPASGLVTPDGDSWTDAIQVPVNTTTKDISFPVAGTIGADKALFVRVQTIHSLKETDGTPYVVKYGPLKSPSDLSVTTNSTTFKASISAENNSDVPGAMLAVCYRASSKPNTHTIIAIIPNGSSEVTNVQCPNWSNESWYKFGVYAFCGTYKNTPRADGVASYAITSEVMRSEGIIWQSGTMPVAPSNVTVDPTDIPGTVKLTWRWSWAAATEAQLSWADHEDAWNSTDEPQVYTVESFNASEWNISGLETGKMWYFRVRLGGDIGGDITYSPWSDPVSIIPSSAPAIPVLSLSNGVVSPDESFMASWVYISTDNTNQISAEICEATPTTTGTYTYSSPFAFADSEQNITLEPLDSWTNDSLHYLAVSVVSGSGRPSEWSEPVPIRVAAPLTCTISSTSLVSETISAGTDDNDTAVTRTVTSLKALPLTATITGAGTGGTTMLTIERAADFHVERPDETSFNGFEGETIVQYSQNGEAQISIAKDMLYGSLDENAQYRLIATVIDSYGRSATQIIPFEVHWTRPALMPTATILMLDTAVKITPVKPTGWTSGDVCDIYRLSADRPQLIVENADFGTAYVDPFPAIGENGGHRIVFKTADGNYITSTGDIAFYDTGKDLGDNLDVVYSLVDFAEGQVKLLYDSTQSSQWEKDFTSTRYLGGSIQGDWNKGVKLSSSVTVSMVTVEDQDSMRLMRRLAEHAGICHLRTVEGSSYTCDIQVGDDRRYDQQTIRASYTLTITRVDGEALDGITYEEWSAS